MADASPLRHVSKALPPTLLVVGDHDFPMLEADAKAFAAKAKEVGRDVPVVVARDCNHMAVVQGLLKDESQVLTEVVRFLKSAGK